MLLSVVLGVIGRHLDGLLNGVRLGDLETDRGDGRLVVLNLECLEGIAFRYFGHSLTVRPGRGIRQRMRLSRYKMMAWGFWSVC